MKESLIIYYITNMVNVIQLVPQELKKLQQKPCEYKRKTQNRQYFVWNKYGRSININDRNKKKHVSVWIFKHMKSPKRTICYMEHNKNTTSDRNIYIKVIYIHVYHIIIIIFRMVSYKISFQSMRKFNVNPTRKKV